MLAGTEAGISFSYYGMQSLLMLYLTTDLLRPGKVGHVLGFAWFRKTLALLYGPLHGEALAAATVGLFSALIWATPILGGLLADGLLGRTRTIIVGAALQSAGHLLMASAPCFLIAQACLVAGIGCTGSIKAQVGGLYAPSDLKRADGFQIYTVSASAAVIIAPLICGTLGEGVGWGWGFAAAGLGMLAGLAVYLRGRAALPPEPPAAAKTSPARLTGPEWQRLLLLLALLPVLAIGLVGNMEIFGAYLVWAQHSYDLVLFGRSMPVSWLLSFDGLAGVATTLASVLFWRWLARRGRRLDDIVKMAIGASLLTAAMLILAAACWQSGGQRISLAWALAFHMANGLGFTNLYAVGLALYSRAAPKRLAATIVNAYALHLFLASLLVGWLGGLLERMPAARFWLLHAGLVGSAALLLAALAPVCRRVLARQGPAALAAAG